MHRKRVCVSKYTPLFKCFGLMFAFLGSLAGCRDDGLTGVSDDPAVAIATPSRLAAVDDDRDCVEFQGIKHCRLGATKLTPREEGKFLEMKGMSSPEKDGVSILLPDVTNFEAEGRIDSRADDAVLNVRALNEDRIIGTMAVKRANEGYIVSAMFTGDNDGTYTVNLYKGMDRVGSISGLANGSEFYLSHYYPSWLYWWVWWHWAHFWNIQSGPNAGGCVWSFDFPPGDEVLVKVDSGEEVAADRIELEEVVKKSGSYPYLTFNRIEYTTNGGRMLLESENIKDRKE